MTTESGFVGVNRIGMGASIEVAARTRRIDGFKGQLALLRMWRVKNGNRGASGQTLAHCGQVAGGLGGRRGSKRALECRSSVGGVADASMYVKQRPRPDAALCN